MKWHPGVLTVCLSVLLQAGPAFDPVKDVVLSVSGGSLMVKVPKGVHLKTHSFGVVLGSPGTLRLGTLPPPVGQDEAGDPIWRGTVQVELQGKGLAEPVQLWITYQPCTEGPEGMCFLPVKRHLVVPLGAVASERP